MLAKKVSSQSLPNTPSTEVTMDRGKCKIPRGHQMNALYIKLTLGIANATGGSVTLSDAQKQLLFALFQASMNIGDEGHFQKPYDKNDFARMQREFRKYFASELEFYTDATSGLDKPLPNAATTTVAFYMAIPTGKLWPLFGDVKSLIGIGQTQALLVEAKVRLVGTTIAANLTLGTNITCDFWPDVEPTKFDKVAVIPQWNEQTATDVTAEGPPDGLMLVASERTQVHASSPFTNTTLELGGDTIYDGVGSPEVIVQQNDAALLPTKGSLTDRETILYNVLDGERPFPKWPAGHLVFRQNGTQQLGTSLLGFSHIPVIAETEWTRLARTIAQVKNCRIMLVSVASLERIDVPDRLRPFVPAAVLTEEMKEFKAYAGILCDPKGEPSYYVPPSVQEKARNAKAGYEKNGDIDLAADVVQRIAAMIPGAVQSGMGFARGNSNTLNAIRGIIR